MTSKDAAYIKDQDNHYCKKYGICLGVGDDQVSTENLIAACTELKDTNRIA